MKKLLSIFIILFISIGCTSTDERDDIFKWKGTYVGDNSSVAGILNSLQNKDNLNGFELQTKEEPYGIILHYDDLSIKEDILYNATFIFALIHNADWITFTNGMQRTTITRSELHDWYGTNLNSKESTEDLVEMINRFSKDSRKIDELIETENIE
ncbi:DUF4825 domain-containing protein [Bacillus pinisoli]|uniref:DUF4825 domain-containing protein n=1 Tax=Bacillus pinisoli TaxID=2901866 RepID=UPI001FF26128|nr:DUF4825 domain-containing protein [Bacillus pinisoli]